MAEPTAGNANRIDELIDVFKELVQAVEPRYTPMIPAVSSEQQTALFAYEWINGHLGRSDVVPPVLQVERRRGVLVLQGPPMSAVTHARIYAEDGTVEEIVIADSTSRDLAIALADDVPIAFVEFRTEHGAPVAIVHRIPGI